MIDSVTNAAWKAAPVDTGSQQTLAARNLDYRTLSHDGPAYDAWLQALARGFQDGERDDEQITVNRESTAYRRLTGVYDSAGPMAELPVATAASWIGELSVPGGRGIPSCAITSVTVSPTHRRRGIARAMLEGELRGAAAAGVPMAMLTVSESTLYGRYGFAPAAASSSWTIETKRARWVGPLPTGRVDFIPRARMRQLAPVLHERARLSSPGEIDVPLGHWDNIAGTRPDAKEAGKLRALQYADADGEVSGLAVYTVEGNDDDFTKAAVSVVYLLAVTDDAYAALWRFLLELDLVSTVKAHEQSVDEPLLWMIDDQRAATVTLRDHQYVRILDVPETLSARSYGAPGRFALEVSDPLDIAAGRYLLDVRADGRATVSALDGDAPADAVPLALGIRELSAAYLGGVSIATLARAGWVHTTDAAAAARTFGWHVAPRLSIWY
ncbi:MULTISPECIES: GNAT family N-acetyltransferase [unclassified Microbacterium]|uniref:GNAT family N-acetyltransferase n=1 Tax=unclassified Microbacterium TaxID=2609290 RepID=UPI00214B7E6B|nr:MULTISPECIES: GNAT family N-acetyltransferase [unclassified Microbacterium]MCR2784292.1 GNAT family N-acetyltransferase [Microbacterium sp. zg.B96]WIM14880.1 GNAT family N-acetyltransferase [Microbacterium sp. zg-B96]